MANVSVLAVFGSNGDEDKTSKFQKLFYDGMLLYDLHFNTIDLSSSIAVVYLTGTLHCLLG